MELTQYRYFRLKRIIRNCKILCNSSNPFDICKILGIKVHYSTIKDSLFGFSEAHCTENSAEINANIFISSSTSSYAQKIICAHELGHILLQKNQSLNLLDSDNPGDSIYEYEANIFAIELLPHIYRGAKDYRNLSKEELYDYILNKLNYTFFTFNPHEI